MLDNKGFDLWADGYDADGSGARITKSKKDWKIQRSTERNEGKGDPDPRLL